MNQVVACIQSLTHASTTRVESNRKLEQWKHASVSAKKDPGLLRIAQRHPGLLRIAQRHNRRGVILPEQDSGLVFR